MTWGVAVTREGLQSRVVDQLKELSIDHLFLQAKRVVRRRGVRHHLYSPLLFNYIPVAMDHRVARMRGVVDVIGPAREEDVEALRNRCDEYGVVLVGLKRGDRVRASHGFFSLIVGQYDGLRPDCREAAIFSVFGSMRSVVFNEGTLVAA